MSPFGLLYRSFVAFTIVVATLTVMAVLCVVLVVAAVVLAIVATVATVLTIFEEFKHITLCNIVLLPCTLSLQQLAHKDDSQVHVEGNEQGQR